MKKIQICNKCLYSSEHALGITFNNEGVCSGCQIHNEKDILNWDVRLLKLKKIVNKYKSKSRKVYDCIVPITGANDSYFIVYVVKEILKLNPLLVYYNKYFNTSLGIKNISNLRIKFDLDTVSKNVNMNSVKKIVKHTLFEYQNIYWHILAGQTVFPLEVSIKYKIPLIIWGAHQGLEQVGMFSHKNEVEMTRKYRENHDLFGVEADDLLKLENEIKEEDIWQYRYPSDSEINSVGVRGIYLGNYIRWDPTAQHRKMIKNYKFRSSRFARTFDTYDHVDCFNYMHLHDLLKFYKRGYSKVTDHVCREIRHKRITRNEGIELIRFYESENCENLQTFCDWLGISMHSLKFLLNRSKNKKYWTEYDVNKFKFNGPSSYFETHQKKEIDHKNLNKFFLATDKQSNNIQNEQKYIFYGKGV